MKSQLLPQGYLLLKIWNSQGSTACAGTYVNRRVCAEQSLLCARLCRVIPSRRNLAAGWLPLPHVASSGSFQTRLQEQLLKVFIPGGEDNNKQCCSWYATIGRGGVILADLVLRAFPSRPQVGIDAGLEKKFFSLNNFLKLKVKMKKQKRSRPCLVMPTKTARKRHIPL